jgi:hypothetical protein
MTKRAKRTPYSRERKAQALALARIAGAEVASDRTHIPVQSIRRWMDAAGIQPGADLPEERLEALRDLAESTVTADLVAGRIHGVQAMTVAGIARRHIAKPAPPLDPETAEQQEVDRMLRELDPDETHDLSLALIALMHALENDNTSDPVAYVNGLITTHGSLEAWRQWQRTEDRRRLDEQLERNRINSERAIASSRQAMLDAETRSLLAAAEAYLRESADA